MFPGNSSSSSSSNMEPDVIEIAPPSADQIARIAKSKAKGKRKQVYYIVFIVYYFILYDEILSL